MFLLVPCFSDILFSCWVRSRLLFNKIRSWTARPMDPQACSFACLTSSPLSHGERHVPPARARLTITPDEALGLLEARERETPPALWACDREREVASQSRSASPGSTADEPGSPADGAGAARNDGGVARTATRSAAAGSRPSSPDAQTAFLRDGSAREALRDTVIASPVEHPRDGDGDGDGGVSVAGRRDYGHFGSLSQLFEPGDEILVEWKLRRARPLDERRARRYSKPHSFVG